MPPSGFFLDANLFVLLVVGSVGRDLIAKHRRLRAYSAEDYEILIDLLDRVERVFVTPNTLTETSNLLAQHQNRSVHAFSTGFGSSFTRAKRL